MPERQFGPYRLVHQIATGGMAEIHLAKTRGIGGFEKYIALKMIHPNFSSDENFIQMLIDEAKISVQLQHVNIAHIFDLGRVGDTYYIAMEFVDGCDLFKILRRASELDRAMPIEMAVYIAKEVATGLDYAHRKRGPDGRPLSIIHRDVSPQNVLVSTSGEVKVVDFGIAKATMRAKQTAVGVIKGKYYYMSPEQAWGDPLDHRTDIFSAGILLYEMLTGQMLYLEEDMHKLLDMVRKADIPPPSTKRRDVPRELDRIIMRALAKKPVARWQSAHDFGVALERFLHGYAADFTSNRLAAWVSGVFGDAARSGPRAPAAPAPLSPGVPHDSIIASRNEFTDENSLIFQMPDLPAAVRSSISVPVVHGRASNQRTLAGSGPETRDVPARHRPDVMTGSPPPGARVPEKVKVRPLSARLANAHTPHIPLKPEHEDSTFVSGPPSFHEIPEGTVELSLDQIVEERESSADLTEDRTTDDVLPPPVNPLGTDIGTLGIGEDDPTRLDVSSLAGRTRTTSASALPEEGTTEQRTAAPEQTIDTHTEPTVPQGRRAAQHGGRKKRRTPLAAVTFSPVAQHRDARPPAAAQVQPLAPPPPVSVSPTITPAGLRWAPGFESEDSLRFRIPTSPLRKRVALVALGVIATLGLGTLGVALFTSNTTPRTGGLEVISIPPGARVLADGKVVGSTPVTVDKLPLGKTVHLRVELDRFDAWERDENVAEPRIEKVVAAMKPIRGVLRVRSVPSDADVFLNNQPLGKTPLEKQGVDPFAVGTVEVRKVGFKPQRQALAWGDRRELELVFELVAGAN